MTTTHHIGTFEYVNIRIIEDLIETAEGVFPTVKFILKQEKACFGSASAVSEVHMITGDLPQVDLARLYFQGYKDCLKNSV